MYTISMSKKKFETLVPLELDKEVTNSEAKMYRFNYRGKEKVFKNLHRLKGSIFANKLYTLEMLSTYKDVLPSSFVVPDALCAVNGSITGFTSDYIDGINLQVLLNNPKVDLNTKIYYLETIGNILEQLKHIRDNEEVDGIFLNDLHAGNFIVTPSNELKVVDLDSCKICGNKPFASKYLSYNPSVDPQAKPKHLFNHSKKYQIFEKDQPKEYYSELGYIDADENSDLYCYIITIMNFLYGASMNKMTMDEFYDYLHYLGELGFKKKMIDCFERIILDCDNTNPRNYLSDLRGQYEMVGKANHRIYELKNNK